MSISQEQRSFVSEIIGWKPIPEDKLAYYRDRLRHRLHSAILDAFLTRSEQLGLKRKELAIRIHRKNTQITRWISSASNLTLDSISDLMVGLAMDFDGFPFTPIETMVNSTDIQPKTGEYTPVPPTLRALQTPQRNPGQLLIDFGAKASPQVSIRTISRDRLRPPQERSILDEFLNRKEAA